MSHKQRRFDRKFMTVVAVIMFVILPVFGLIWTISEARKDFNCSTGLWALGAIIGVPLLLRLMYNVVTGKRLTTDYEEEFADFLNECTDRHQVVLSAWEAWSSGDIETREYFKIADDYESWLSAEQERLSYEAAGEANFVPRYRE